MVRFALSKNRRKPTCPEVELKDILCRLKPDFNAIRLSEKGNFLLISKSIKENGFPIRLKIFIGNPFSFYAL